LRTHYVGQEKGKWKDDVQFIKAITQFARPRSGHFIR
jgi:hypothetical protein